MGLHMATHPPISRPSLRISAMLLVKTAPDEISGGQRHAECADANGEARPATAKELAQPVSRKLCSVTEELVNGSRSSAGSLGSPAGRSRWTASPSVADDEASFAQSTMNSSALWVEVSFPGTVKGRWR